MDRAGTTVLHIHFRLGALYWIPQPVARRMRSSVHQIPVVQYGSDYRLFLDSLDRPLHSLRRNL